MDRTKVWLVIRRIAFGLVIAYWVIAGCLGTLLMANVVTMAHIPNMERIVFNAIAARYYRHAGKVELCGGDCFKENSAMDYKGIRIVKPEDLHR